MGKHASIAVKVLIIFTRALVAVNNVVHTARTTFRCGRKYILSSEIDKVGHRLFGHPRTRDTSKERHASIP